jgi:pimeloyl-ACP methyl ester carboxylesterase
VSFLREVAFPDTDGYLLTTGVVAGTFVTGAIARVQNLRIQFAGNFAGGLVRMRAFGANADIDTFTFPAAAATGQGHQVNIPLAGKEYPNGLVIVADAGITGSVSFEDTPRTNNLLAQTKLTLNRVRKILGKSTPHPFNGLAKWGVFPGQTATAATWDADVDGELFYIQFPTGYCMKGQGGIRLVLAHHQLKNDPNTNAVETTLDEECGRRGFLYASPTSMLNDTWPNDNSVDNLEAVLHFLIDRCGADPEDLNLVGFSLGGQQVSRFAAVHRDPVGLMARTICPVAPDWEQLVWQRKQHNNTNLGDSVPAVPLDPPNTLCDPNPGTATSSLWRSQQQRLDQMGGPWPGGDNISAIGLAWRASAILALDPASYAETGPMTSVTPVAPTPSAADIPAATVDANRSLAVSLMWTPTLIYYGDDDALVIIPPLTAKLRTHFQTVNPDGAVGFQPTFVNVGIFGGNGAHTWNILDVGNYFDFLDRTPPLIRYPGSFEYVTHRNSASSYCTITKSAANDLSRFRCVQSLTPGSEGWVFSSEVRVTRIVIDASKSGLPSFNFGAGAPLHVTTSTNWDIVVKNLPHVPAGATGANVGTVTVGFDGANSIRIQPAGAGAIAASIT